MIADYGLILDILIVVLLCATVVYAAQLNRRIVRLRDNRAELHLATRAMAEAAAKAEAGIQGLKATAGSVGVAIQADVEKARSLREELSFLVEAGEAMAGRLEAAASGVGRAAEKAGPAPTLQRQGVTPSSPNADPAGMRRPTESRPDRARRDLMKTIENLR